MSLELNEKKDEYNNDSFDINNSRKNESKSIKLFGVKHYLSVARQATIILVVFVMFGILIGFVPTVINYFNRKKDADIIKSDYKKYQEMITYAEENPEYIINARVCQKEYKENYGKWKIIYSFLTDNLETVEVSSYYVYLKNEINLGSQIQIVVDSVPVTTETKTIPIEFKNIILEEMEEWTDYNYKIMRNKSEILILSIVMALGICLIIVVCATSPTKEKVSNDKEYANKSTDEKSENKQIDKINTVICKYCGSVIGENNIKCPFCGATIKKRKNKNKK